MDNLNQIYKNIFIYIYIFFEIIGHNFESTFKKNVKSFTMNKQIGKYT